MIPSKCNQETDHNSQTQWHNMLHVGVNGDDDGNGDTIFRLKKCKSAERRPERKPHDQRNMQAEAGNSRANPRDAHSRINRQGGKETQEDVASIEHYGFSVKIYGEAQPPATSTHSLRQLPCLPSTSTMSVSQRHRQPTPFSLTGSGFAQYSSSSIRFFSSSVVVSR